MDLSISSLSTPHLPFNLLPSLQPLVHLHPQPNPFPKMKTTKTLSLLSTPQAWHPSPPHSAPTLVLLLKQCQVPIKRWGPEMQLPVLPLPNEHLFTSRMVALWSHRMFQTTYFFYNNTLPCHNLSPSHDVTCLPTALLMKWKGIWFLIHPFPPLSVNFKSNERWLVFHSHHLITTNISSI